MGNTCDETKCNGDCATCGGEDLRVTLTLDDDSTVECAIITILPVEEKNYIVLLPLDENGENEDGEVYLYRYVADPNGGAALDNIESDEEYELVAEAFDEWLDAQEYDEIVGEDELN